MILKGAKRPWKLPWSSFLSLWALSFFLVFTLLLFPSHSFSSSKTKGTSRAKVLLRQADTCSKAIKGKKKRYRHYWERCISKYELIFRKYPTSPQAPWALYKAARLYTRLYRYSGLEKDLDTALNLYTKIVQRYEKHRLADDAQYYIGEIYYKYKNDPTKAYVEFVKLDIKFPSGDMRPKGKVMLDKLAVILAKKEVASRGGKGGKKGKIAQLKGIRHWSTPTYTRVVVDMDHPVVYRHDFLPSDPEHGKPARIYLDIKGARVSSEIDSKIPIGDGLLQRARAGQHTNQIVRVVLDLESIGLYKVFHLYEPFRIVVDVKKKKGAKIAEKAKPSKKRRPVKRGIRKSGKPDQTLSLARQLGLTVKRVVIDPGHGGKDPGCYYGGIKEKDIVLRVAKILGKKLKNLGYEVYLTRSTDRFLSLERRTAIANMKKADLFISLHVNAHRSKRVRGLETYFLNMATDERAMLVAARENAVSQKNISDLQAILNDLMLNTKIHESSRLAHSIHKGMVYNLKKRYKYVNNLGVKQAPFYVLIGAQMPSVLIEIGFITNSTERKRLTNSKYQALLASGICAGIKRYVESINMVYKGG